MNSSSGPGAIRVHGVFMGRQLPNFGENWGNGRLGTQFGWLAAVHALRAGGSVLSISTARGDLGEPSANWVLLVAEEDAEKALPPR